MRLLTSSFALVRLPPDWMSRLALQLGLKFEIFPSVLTHPFRARADLPTCVTRDGGGAFVRKVELDACRFPSLLSLLAPPLSPFSSCHTLFNHPEIKLTHGTLPHDPSPPWSLLRARRQTTSKSEGRSELTGPSPFPPSSATNLED